MVTAIAGSAWARSISFERCSGVITPPCRHVLTAERDTPTAAAVPVSFDGVHRAAAAFNKSFSVRMFNLT